ncbi:MAG: hypothetical protein CL799_08415 [Chromatiales bacterium]|nr:hypothetical protein [Chromatiales bacterium]
MPCGRVCNEVMNRLKLLMLSKLIYLWPERLKLSRNTYTCSAKAWVRIWLSEGAYGIIAIPSIQAWLTIEVSFTFIIKMLYNTVIAVAATNSITC